MSIALSTAWAPKGAARLGKVLAAGRKIGFKAFELGVSRVPLDLDAATDAVERGRGEIGSVHAVCTEEEVPAAACRGDWVAEPDELLRREGVRLAKASIDSARRVGARAVVLHGGALPLPDARRFQYEMYRLISRGGTVADCRPVLDRLRSDRAALAPPYLRALQASLAEVCEYAGDLLIGLENRYYLSELPQGDEFAELFDRVAAPNLRYWHDVGHAHVLDRIGFVRHLELLERYGPRLAGMHLHDIHGFEDHRPPGTGEFNFAALTDFLRPDTLCVMEISDGHPARAVKRGRKHLANVYGIE